MGVACRVHVSIILPPDLLIVLQASSLFPSALRYARITALAKVEHARHTRSKVKAMSINDHQGGQMF
jgi:hypothetical protein